MAVLIVTRLEKVALLTFAVAVLTDDLSVAEVSRSVVASLLDCRHVEKTHADSGPCQRE